MRVSTLNFSGNQSITKSIILAFFFVEPNIIRIFANCCGVCPQHEIVWFEHAEEAVSVAVVAAVRDRGRAVSPAHPLPGDGGRVATFVLDMQKKIYKLKIRTS